MPSELDSFSKKYKSTEDANEYKKQRFSRSKKWIMTDQRERQLFKEAVEKLQPNSLLDIPCGGGRFIEVWEAAGVPNIWGVDASESMLEVARSIAPDHVRENILHGDGRDLPFDDNNFDFVSCIRLLHRITESAERITLFKELARVSKGHVMLTFYNSRTLQSFSKKIKGKYAGVSVAQISKELLESGLQPIEDEALKGKRYQQHFILCKKV